MLPSSEERRPETSFLLRAWTAWTGRLTRTGWVFPTALVALTFAVYARSIPLPLVYWDDQIYLLEDTRLKEFSLGSIWKILTATYFSNYHPVTTLTYALDRAIWGMWLPGFHITQLAFYTVGTVLVYYLFRSILGNAWAAFAGAALWTVHTVHVEPVAWLASRKDIVCLAFYVGSVLAYVRYVRGEKRRVRLYLASVALAAAAMLSKGCAVVLPAVLFAYDVCFEKKIGRRHFLDKIPFLVLTVVVTILTVLAQDKDSALVHPAITWWQRFLLLCEVFASYVGRAILPVRLCAKYMVRWGGLNRFVAFLGAILGGGAVAGFLALRRRWPAAAFGIGLFVFPLGTVMNTFFTLRIWMTDRYLFLPTIGSSLALAAAGIRLHRWKALPRGARTWGLTVAAVTLVALYSTLTVVRIGVWTSEVMFWSDVVRKQLGFQGSGLVTARQLRGRKLLDIQSCVTLASAYKRAGDAQESRRIMNTIGELPVGLEMGGALEMAWSDIEAGRPGAAICRLRPIAEGATQEAPVAWTWMGVAYENKGEIETARQAHTEAVKLYRERGRSPVPAMLNIGFLELRQRRFDEAARWFSRARHEAPNNDPRPIFYLGMSLEKKGEIEQAERLYREALGLENRVPPDAFFDLVDVHQQLANLLERLGRRQEALGHFAEIVRSTPDHPQSAGIHLKMAIIEDKLGHVEEALAHLSEVLRHDPTHPQQPDILLKMGLLEEKLGHNGRAVDRFEECLRLKPDHPQLEGIRAKMRDLRARPSAPQPEP